MAALTPTQPPAWQQDLETTLIQLAIAPLVKVADFATDSHLKSDAAHIAAAVGFKKWCVQKIPKGENASVDQVGALFEATFKKYIKEIAQEIITQKEGVVDSFYLFGSIPFLNADSERITLSLDSIPLDLPPTRQEEDFVVLDEPRLTILSKEVALLREWKKNPSLLYLKIPDRLKESGINILKAAVEFPQALN